MLALIIAQDEPMLQALFQVGGRTEQTADRMYVDLVVAACLSVVAGSQGRAPAGRSVSLRR